MKDTMQEFAHFIQLRGEVQSGTHFDVEENYRLKIQVDLRRHLGTYPERFARGACLLLEPSKSER